MDPVKSMAALRDQLSRFQSWREAHADFEAAVAHLPPEKRGVAPAGLPYSPWQLVEHLRRTQADILEFCSNVDYVEQKWPDDYWPKSAAPTDETDWDASVTAFLRDRATLQQMIKDPSCDLFARVPAGNGQTYLREFLLVADHTAYHVGQLIAVRRLLGAWSTS